MSVLRRSTQITDDVHLQTSMSRTTEGPARSPRVNRQAQLPDPLNPMKFEACECGHINSSN